MSSTFVYDANQVSIILFGIPIDGGYDEDDFLTIEQTSDDFTMMTGADGSVVISATNDRTAKITLKLLQGAAGNDALSVARTLQIAKQNGTGMGPFLVKDLLGTSLYSGLHCFIQKPPEVVFARSGKARVWTLGCTDLVRFDGSNSSI